MASISSPTHPSNSADFFSSLGSNYETAFSHDAGLLSFLQRLLGRLPPNSHILDIGSGTGNPVSSTLANAGHRVSGIDISTEMIRLASAAVPSGNFVVADMRTYEPPAGTKFDAVIAVLSMFQLTREEVEAQVRKWREWVTEGGLVNVCSIAAEELDVEARGSKLDADGRCASEVGFKFMGETFRITLFTTKGWREMLEENGFEVVEATKDLFVPPKEANCEEEMHVLLTAKKVR